MRSRSRSWGSAHHAGGHRCGRASTHLALLAGLRGDRSRNLGVTEFGQSSDLADAYRIHGIDTATIVDCALSVTER